ncbi:MAG TPA: Y-family DNA polymerase [Rhodobacteraceae bacterium]|nr:Y-family DNA polymerase [Paracoccaceae bacterium]
MRLQDTPKFALVDCAHFYASCERVFRPDLQDRPVVVLSNNDGNLIALSPEAKALGLKMGTPFYQVEKIIRRHKVALFSSNFPLYADFSARVMTVLGQFTPDLEIYSIDEAFLGLAGNEDSAWAASLHQTVKRWTAIPVRVGIGATKTLAKAAQAWAKSRKCNHAKIVTESERRTILPQLPVGDVWGIGPHLEMKLQRLGIDSAWELSQLDPQWLRRRFSVVVARTALELQGISCLDLEQIPPPRKQICRSRSFRPPMTEKQAIAAALAAFTTRAAEKLRQEGMQAQVISVFLGSDIFDRSQPYYTPVVSATLPGASADTGRLLKAMAPLFDSIYRPGFRYRRAGIILSQLLNTQEGLQQDLAKPNENSALMAAIDQVNRRYPQGLKPASALSWHRRCYQPQYLSPRYTTDWRQLPTVWAK